MVADELVRTGPMASVPMAGTGLEPSGEDPMSVEMLEVVSLTELDVHPKYDNIHNQNQRQTFNNPRRGREYTLKELVR
jgi:hypothetical protein